MKRIIFVVGIYILTRCILFTLTDILELKKLALLPFIILQSFLYAPILFLLLLTYKKLTNYKKSLHFIYFILTFILANVLAYYLMEDFLMIWNAGLNNGGSGNRDNLLGIFTHTAIEGYNYISFMLSLILYYVIYRIKGNV